MKTNNIQDLLAPIIEKITSITQMPTIIVGTDEQILKFALLSELERLRGVDELNLSLRERIRYKMRELHIGVSEIAYSCGMSVSTMSRYLSGRGSMNSEHLERVLTHLNLIK